MTCKETSAAGTSPNASHLWHRMTMLETQMMLGQAWDKMNVGGWVRCQSRPTVAGEKVATVCRNRNGGNCKGKL